MPQDRNKTIKKYLTIKISGESGQGINSIGEVLTIAFKSLGFYTFGYREYPSLIKGGNASYQIEVTNKKTCAIHKQSDVLLAISRESIYEYLNSVKEGGTILHSLVNLYLTSEQQKYVDDNNISINYFNADELSLELGGSGALTNVIMLSILWKTLGLESKIIANCFMDRFSHKPELLALDIKALNYVFENNLLQITLNNLLDFSGASIEHKIDEYSKDNKAKHLTITGNHALALGALSAGLRAIYTYPMTPATSIFSYLANTAKKTGVLIKQAEDEITAIQMTLGSSFVGTRAMAVTSGGGFDIMTESISLAGMTETPLVLVLAQRPGPATGLPTWTSAADLEVALYSGHGEFPRCVLTASDAKSAYMVIQKAFNVSEKYQLPVIVLTDKYIAESLYQVESFDKSLKIKRELTEETLKNLLVPEDRYKVSDLGISKRWIPGSSEVTFKANSDEHTADGSSTEDSEKAKAMYDKRLYKLDALKDSLEEPKYIGPESPKYCFVGWGSNRGVILNGIEESIKSIGKNKVGYLHYENIWPLKTETIEKFLKENIKLIIVESNATAQLGKLISQNVVGLEWYAKLLKYDGRPFYIEEITNFISNLE